MNTKIILAVLLALSLIVNGIFLLNQDNESNTSPEIIIDDTEGYLKPWINIKCIDNQDCYEKKDEMEIFCGQGYIPRCGFDNFCECEYIEITRG